MIFYKFCLSLVFSPEMHPGFSDKEFLVDAGIALPLGVFDNNFSKINHCSNEDNNTNDPMDPQTNENEEVNENVSNEKFNQNELKQSTKKKYFKHSIPIRKKTNLSDHGGNKKTQDIAKRRSLQLGNTVKRNSLQVGEIPKSNSVQEFDTEKYNSDELSLSERMSLLEVNTEIDKRHSIEIMDTGQTFENVDINKNLTQNTITENTHSPNTIQRRKKSQLPRPLSCVGLPVRTNGIDKANSTSKLPVMR